MTDAAAPHPAPATRLRPAAVTAATWLLAAVAAAYLIDAIMIIAGSGEYPDRVRAAMEESGVSPAAWSFLSGIVSVMPVVAAGLTIVSAVVVLAMAAAVARGSFVGRILTWVAVGFALLCNVCGLGSAGTPSFSSVAYVNANSRDRTGVHVFAQRLPEAYPDWYRHTSLALFTFGMLAMIAVAVLLAMPAANAWFRRVPRLKTGPYGAPVGYPAHPGGQYPAAPAALTPEQVAEALSTLERRRQRGELTDEQYAAERARLNG
ncbi:SHOCT domain-containing protein [Catellatospora vulcania]|uniref:SHOCT domain-containing protein n=1 Tax=Catellatospora vulcania TaxID=1460450 RepID=UPI0012D37E8A|nr:SHOCT domain-containing protein [Catellatospora vulcania]